MNVRTTEVDKNDFQRLSSAVRILFVGRIGFKNIISQLRNKAFTESRNQQYIQVSLDIYSQKSGSTKFVNQYSKTVVWSQHSFTVRRFYYSVLILYF